MKVSILDGGKSWQPQNWIDVEGESFKLYVDGEYIGAVDLDPEIGLILVSTLHKVEFRKDD